VHPSCFLKLEGKSVWGGERPLTAVVNPRTGSWGVFFFFLDGMDSFVCAFRFIVLALLCDEMSAGGGAVNRDLGRSR
jgi:hypothetical protein